MIVTRKNYPRLHAALEMIECDSGGHLIGRVYPGEPIDLERFVIPEAWVHLVSGAEHGLSNLIAGSETLFETFVIGDQDEADKMERTRGDLSEARILLNGYFDGWPPEEAPFTSSLTRPEHRAPTPSAPDASIPVQRPRE